MQTKVVKWGNSLGLRIPKSFAEEVQVTEGTLVDLTIVDGSLVVTASSASDFSLKDLLAQVSEENIHSEVDFGESVGQEQW